MFTLFTAIIFFCPFCIADAFAFSLPSSSGTPHIYFEADNLQYDRKKGEMKLDGDVRIIEKDRGRLEKVISGKKFSVFPSSGIIISSAPLLVEEGLNAVYGENGVFNWISRKGRLNNVSASYDVWRILNAESAEFETEKYVYKNAKITSCNHENPHYHIRMSRMTVIPKRRIFGFNGVFYLGATPVFYLPFFYKPLGTENDYITYVNVGYDERNGAHFKTTTVYDFARHSRGKLFLDYFTRLTFGTGLEYTYSKPNMLMGSISGYRIREPCASSDRWGVTGGYWYKIKDDMTRNASGALYYSQSQFRMVSDPSFNNDFFRSNPYIITTDKNASLAFVRQTHRTTMQLSYLKKEAVLSKQDTFTKTLESRPRFDFQTTPFALKKLPFLNTFTAYFDSFETDTINYYQQTAGGRWVINKSVPVNRTFSFFPSLFYDQTVIFSPKKSDASGYDSNQWVGKYGTKVNLRINTILGATDLTYSFSQRLSTNTLSSESSSADKGIESNFLSFQNFFRPRRNVYFKLMSGYDFRYVKGEVKEFDKRLEPVIGEISYRPNQDFNFFVQDSYEIGEGNKSFIVQAEFGRFESNNMSIGVANYKSEPDNFIFNQNISWYPQKEDGKLRSWHIKGGLGYIFATKSGFKFKTAQIFSKTFTLYKDFHDFHTEWCVKIRQGVKLFSFKVSLRFNEVKKRIRSKREAQAFSHPWGGNADMR